MKRNEILQRIGLDIPAASRLRVLLDTDAKNEADDQYAITHHLLTPMFDVRGIVATHFEQKAGYGGESMEKSYRELETLLALSQIDDVPIARGCAHPLKDESDAPDSSESVWGRFAAGAAELVMTLKYETSHTPPRRTSPQK